MSNQSSSVAFNLHDPEALAAIERAHEQGAYRANLLLGKDRWTKADVSAYTGLQRTALSNFLRENGIERVLLYDGTNRWTVSASAVRKALARRKKQHKKTRG